MTSLMLAGLAVAGGALGARILMGSFKQFQKTAAQLPKSPMFTSYYKGGFEPKITKREASLILGNFSVTVLKLPYLFDLNRMNTVKIVFVCSGISSSSPKEKIKEAHKKIMLLNHPDRGGSPYLAAKINEAKDYLETGGKSARGL